MLIPRVLTKAVLCKCNSKELENKKKKKSDLKVFTINSITLYFSFICLIAKIK